MPYLWLALAILFEVMGTSALKLSDGFSRLLPVFVTFVGYGASFYLLSLCLQSLGVGFVYAVWAGVGMVLIAIVGVVFFADQVDWQGLAGMALIIAGVVVLSGFSRMGG